MWKNAFLFEDTKDNAEYFGCVVSLGFSLPARAAEGSGWTYQDLKVRFSVGSVYLCDWIECGGVLVPAQGGEGEHREGSAVGYIWLWNHYLNRSRDMETFYIDDYCLKRMYPTFSHLISKKSCQTCWKWNLSGQTELIPNTFGTSQRVVLKLLLSWGITHPFRIIN